jgi:hypothetical protein
MDFLPIQRSVTGEMTTQLGAVTGVRTTLATLLAATSISASRE